MGDVLTINRTPGDFVQDTQHLTTVEVGAYQMILDQIVIRGQNADPPSLPDDDTILANITRMSLAQWRRIKPRLCEGDTKVLSITYGRIYQVRIAFEIEEARRRIAGQSAKGRRSGEVRKAKAALKARFENPDLRTNRGSNHGLTAVRTGHEPEHEPRTNRTVNRGGTTHESRVMSNESRELTSLPTTPVLPEQPPVGIAAVEFVQHVAATMAPHVPPPDDFTVTRWLRDISPDPYWIAAVICEAQVSLADARTPGYITGILNNRRAEHWTCDDARFYVEYRLMAKAREAEAKA